MRWSDAIKEPIQALQSVVIDAALMQRLWPFLDLTSLHETDTASSLVPLFEKAQTMLGHVAAVCVAPAFVRLAAAEFANTPVKVATVANFPEGTASLDSVLLEIGRALQDGANEVDVVFPYQRYLAGEQQYAAHTFVESCKAVCGENVLLKVILETGALVDPVIIAEASYDVLAAGADFIKTSTGKIAEGATLEAVATMLLVIKPMSVQFKRRIGLKVSGGIRDVRQAAQYLALADHIMGQDWATSATFRIGASRLVDEMLKNRREGV